MPTYTYRCKVCGHQFDERQKFSDDPLTECPNCNGRLRRLVNNTGGIVFKGSGFYINDSKSGSKGKTSAIPASTKSSEDDSTPNGSTPTAENNNNDNKSEKKKSKETKEKTNSTT